MRRCFYLRLAFANIRRNRVTYLPYLVATAIMSGVFLLIAGLTTSPTLNNLPAGQTAAAVFAMGQAVFVVFVFFFMAYINNFLIAQRKKEFGLYAILGMNKQNVGRVLVWENLLILCGGVLLGILSALVLGRLMFLVLLRLIHAAPGSSFSLSGYAYLATLALFALIFLYTSVTNLFRVHTASPIALLSSQKRGEKDSPLLLPGALLGAVLLGIAYYFAWTLSVPGVALGLFFPLAVLVILATHLLFRSGSIAVLKALRANKGFYYKPSHFITVSGLFHRMRQNARSLATLCILSCMLVVTVSGTLSLYLGREQMYRGMYPFDVQIGVHDFPQAEIDALPDAVSGIAAKHNVSISAELGKFALRSELDDDFSGMMYRNNMVDDLRDVAQAGSLARVGSGSFVFDAAGSEEDCLAFMGALEEFLNECSAGCGQQFSISDVFHARQDGYGMYGGLLFLGAFFAVLFLAVAVLILYFKQITEGYEDRERFVILQQVGMDDRQVRSTIDRQVLWVFFLPLLAAALHMVFASKIMARMLQTFMLYDWGLVLLCVAGALGVFALLYLAVYRMTAKVYYSIVKR